MKTLNVTMNDLYSRVSFPIEVSDIQPEHIKNAIEDNYDYVRDNLDRIMGGMVEVRDDGNIVAYGTIMWYFMGGHSLDIMLGHPR